jgi:hypothetical protein
MRRRTLLVALAGLAVVVAAGAVVLWPGPDRITLENLHEIRMGLSLAEVEAILGPAGDYCTAPARFTRALQLSATPGPLSGQRAVLSHHVGGWP